MHKSKCIAAFSNPFIWILFFSLPFRAAGQQEKNKGVDYYSKLIDIQPDNAVLFCCRAEAWYELGKSKKALNDINIALKKIDSRLCKCDLSQYTTVYPERICTARTLTQLYEQRAQIYEDQEKFEKAAEDREKALSILSPLPLKSLTYDAGDAIIVKINDLYSIIALDYMLAGRYPAALSTYSSAIASPSYRDRRAKSFFKARSKVEIILGQYADATHDRDSIGLDFKDQISIPEVFDYLAVLIAQRKFNEIDGALSQHYQAELDNKGHQKFYFFGQWMDKKRESSELYRRIKSNDLEYSFFYYYLCISEIIARKDYASAIKRVDRQLRRLHGQLFYPYKKHRKNDVVEPFLLASNLYSLKGYLLGKQDSLNDAQIAYKKALKIDTNCTEAALELLVLQARIIEIAKKKKEKESEQMPMNPKETEKGEKKRKQKSEDIKKGSS